MIFRAVLISCFSFWFIIVFKCTSVFSQVCVETKLVYRDVPETYLYTYMEAYKKTNCLFWCTDTRVATAVGTRYVRKLVPEQINICCEGYIKDELSTSNSIHCKPVCSPSCVNGYCKSPEVCVCDPGYILDAYDPHKCSPLCINGCDHGICVAPNTCQCDSGYNLLNGVCEPVCSEACDYGTCVAPQTCQCHPGYKKSENNTCEPYCSGYTASGECIITLICEEGWTKVIKDQFEECEPMCTNSCIHGTCIAPETCECLDGYEKSINDSCEPYCSSGCLHGTCISPDICVCDPGWYKEELSSECIAHCDNSCRNGTCVAPNVCDCLPGYKLDKIVHQKQQETNTCAPICSNCEGICIAPGKCVCEPPKESMQVGIDGEPCDCLENCPDDARKCERTICLINTNTESVTESGVVDAGEETTVPINIFSTTDIMYDTSTVENIDIDYNELIIQKTSWLNPDWFYAVGSFLFLAIIILIAVVILKKKKIKSFNSKIFNRNNLQEERLKKKKNRHSV